MDEAVLARLRTAIAAEVWDRLKESIPLSQVPQRIVEAIAVTALVVQAEWHDHVEGGLSMSEPFDASELRGWMQQVEYWLGDYQSGKDRKAEALQMVSASLAMLVRSADSLRALVRERLGAQ